LYLRSAKKGPLARAGVTNFLSRPPVPTPRFSPGGTAQLSDDTLPKLVIYLFDGSVWDRSLIFSFFILPPPSGFPLHLSPLGEFNFRPTPPPSFQSVYKNPLLRPTLLHEPFLLVKGPHFRLRLSNSSVFSPRAIPRSALEQVGHWSGHSGLKGITL